MKSFTMPTALPKRNVLKRRPPQPEKDDEEESEDDYMNMALPDHPRKRKAVAPMACPATEPKPKETSPPKPLDKPSANDGAGEDYEEDYMSMAIPEPGGPGAVSETSAQRAARERRERAARGQVKSKAQLATEAEQAREEGLARNLLLHAKSGTAGTAGASKALRMMERMGYKVGESLGAKKPTTAAVGDGTAEEASMQAGVRDSMAESGTPARPEGDAAAAATEPIRIRVKADRGGIGLDSERARKLREAAGELGASNTASPAAAADPAVYRDRMARERAKERRERQLNAAMKLAWEWDEEGGQDGKESGDDGRAAKRPLKSINVLWRGFVRRQEQAERDRRMRHDLQQSLPVSVGTRLLPTYVDEDEDADYRLALGIERNEGKKRVFETADDLDENDEELAAFEALDVEERLAKVVGFLRDTYRYCFWCKFKYPDPSMEGCPGLTEDDHD